MTGKKSENRKRQGHILLRVSAEEKAAIEKNASDCGLKTAAFLRNVGIGYQVKGIVDQKAILSLVRVNADLGRLGGLLKLWLSQRDQFGREAAGLKVSDVRSLFHKIEASQQQVKARLEEL